MKKGKTEHRPIVTVRKEKREKIDDILKRIENTLDISSDGMVECSQVFEKVIRARQQIQKILLNY